MIITTIAPSQNAISDSDLKNKHEKMLAVTLCGMLSAPLFGLSTRTASEAKAISNAERIYAALTAAVVGVSDLHGEKSHLLHDAGQTQVQRGVRESEAWRLQYLVRFADGVRPAGTDNQLLRSGAVGLLDEVICADPGLLTALTSGAVIEPCPYQDWPRSTGWITVDCAFRTTDSAARIRDMRPASTAMREATRLIVLDILSSCRETIHVPLAHRCALGRFVINSATLRAARKSQGPRIPTKLVDWLRVHGNHNLADAVRATTELLQK